MGRIKGIVVRNFHFISLYLLKRYETMTASSLKKRIISKLDEVNNTEVLKAVYTILESTSDQRAEYRLTAAQEKELDLRIALHASGKSKSYPWEEVKERLKSSRPKE